MPTFLARGRQFLLAAVIVTLPMLAAVAAEVWQTLPPMPTRPPATQEGRASVNGIELYYAVYGKGSPVILLHGGLGNSDYWGNLIPALADRYQVIVMDSRGHGRSTRDAQPYGYDLMASDVLALMDFLKLPKADIVGWSDGGIIGLDIAMNHPDRIGKLFAFGANSNLAGLKDGFDKNPNFAAFIERGMFCSKPGLRLQQPGETCSASPSRSSLAARPTISRRSSGSSTTSAGRRSAVPEPSSTDARRARSRRVHRSASTSLSSVDRISRSVRGPSSNVARSSARDRNPRLM